MKIFISILIAIYILWSFMSIISLEFYPDEPKCFKITNYINLGILCLAIIVVTIGLLTIIIYNAI